jgi:hypothetical protein
MPKVWTSFALTALMAATATGAFAQEPPAEHPAVVSDDLLSDLSGGANTAIALTEQDLTAINAGNHITADNVGSGAISLEGSALSGFAGIGNFVMNTGHNNNLQSSLSVTVIVQ